MRTPPPGGRIDIYLPESYYRVPVDVHVNDQPVFQRERFGGPIPVPPGRHTVTCESRARHRFGLASLTVDVQPGQVVEVFYAPPHTLVSKPAIGFTPQRRRFALTTLGWIFLVGGLAIALLGAFFG